MAKDFEIGHRSARVPLDGSSGVAQPGMTNVLGAEFAFHADPGCVGEARAWLEACLRGEFRHAGADHLVADALMIASELVTNAINANCVTGRLGWRAEGGALRLWVFDDGPGWPVLQNPGPLDPHGRGLQIVRALAVECSARKVPGGKETWATVPLLSG